MVVTKRSTVYWQALWALGFIAAGLGFAVGATRAIVVPLGFDDLWARSLLVGCGFILCLYLLEWIVGHLREQEEDDHFRSSAND